MILLGLFNLYEFLMEKNFLFILEREFFLILLFLYIFEVGYNNNFEGWRIII